MLYRTFEDRAAAVMGDGRSVFATLSSLGDGSSMATYVGSREITFG
jgi:hypothetical protein